MTHWQWFLLGSVTTAGLIWVIQVGIAAEKLMTTMERFEKKLKKEVKAP